jgi:hypothetical protein
MKASTLRSLRTWHHLIGVFLAPAILFFSFSGLIQVIGIQDQRNPAPPAWIAWMAGIHKHQAAPKPRPERKPDAKPEGRHEEHEDHDHGGFTPLKIFALLTAIGLFVTTLIGLAIALGTRSTRARALVMLVLGVAVPVGLMLL